MSKTLEDLAEFIEQDHQKELLIAMKSDSEAKAARESADAMLREAGMERAVSVTVVTRSIYATKEHYLKLTRAMPRRLKAGE